MINKIFNSQLALGNNQYLKIILNMIGFIPVEIKIETSNNINFNQLFEFSNKF